MQEPFARHLRAHMRRTDHLKLAALLHERPSMTLRMTSAILLGSVGIVTAALVETIIRADFSGSLVIGAFLLSLIALKFFRKNIADEAVIFFSAAAIFNTIGYRWNLYRAPGPFDEVAHAYTSFAVTLIAGQLLYGDFSKSFKNNFFLSLFTVANTGVVIGVSWEFFEWAVAILGDLNDTLSDLLLDWIGAAIAAFVVTSRGRNSSIGDHAKDKNG